MKTIKSLALSLLLTISIFISPLQAQAPISDIKPLSSYSVPELIVYFSEKYNVSEQLASTVAKSESGLIEKKIGDMNLICKSNGRPVRARGVYQITECYHPEVSDEQAFDKVFNVEWGIKTIASGRCKNEFSTCRGLKE